MWEAQTRETQIDHRAPSGGMPVEAKLVVA